MSNIHDTAIIEDGAKVADSAHIGPYCHIGPNVQIDADVELKSHVSISGHTTVGEGTTVFPFASLGSAPQDLKYKGEKSQLIIGKNNKIREHVTMNPGTEAGGLVTKVGDNGLFMTGAHVAHDCQIGDNVILANNATLAGHVEVGNHAVFGGLCAVHQFVRIGDFAMVGGMSGVEQDIIPFGLVTGNRGRLSGLNVIGLKRGGFSKEDIQALRSAYQSLFVSEERVFADRLEEVSSLYEDNKTVRQVIDFIKQDSKRAICQPHRETDRE
jgi:UDP-N-acetylglucosamine acyltransferase